MNQTTSNTANYTTTNKANYSVGNNAIKYGLIAGGLIALYFFIIQSFGLSNIIGLKYAGYGILGIILALGLIDYDQFLKEGTTFKNGIFFAAKITLFAGLTLLAINTITFLSDSSLVFSKYGIEATSFPTLVILSGALFFEVIVVGMIFTFVILQYLKSRKDFEG